MHRGKNKAPAQLFLEMSPVPLWVVVEAQVPRQVVNAAPVLVAQNRMKHGAEGGSLLEVLAEELVTYIGTMRRRGAE